MLDLGWEVLALLVAAGFVAGFIDSIAGGGGLIGVPVLLLAGADPVTALATNKIQGLFGSASAAISYARAGLVNPRRQLAPAAMAFGASVLGALAVSVLPTDLLRAALPVLLIAIALFFALKPGLDDLDRTERISPRLFMLTLAPAIGFYDGLLGPGAGSFYMLGFVMLAGYGVLRATAHTKLLNLASNCGGLLAFAFVASPWWGVGLLMGAAQFAGAQVGARLAARVGARLIKPLLVVMTTAMALRLMWDWI